MSDRSLRAEILQTNPVHTALTVMRDLIAKPISSGSSVQWDASMIIIRLLILTISHY